MRKVIVSGAFGFCLFAFSACHPLMPEPSRKEIRQGLGWKGVSRNKIYELKEAVALSNGEFDVHQDIKFAKNVMPKNTKLRVIKLVSVDTFNINYVSAKCEILTGIYKGNVMSASFTEEFLANLRVPKAEQSDTPNQ